MTDTRITIIDSQGRISARVYASLADVSDAAIGTIVCVDNGSVGEFYVRVHNPEPSWQPITGGLSHVAANGTSVSPDPATINFVDGNFTSVSAITDIADPSKADVTINTHGLVHRVEGTSGGPATDVEVLQFTSDGSMNIAVSQESSHYAGIGIFLNSPVVRDVTTHRLPSSDLLRADIIDGTLDIYAPDPCDCGATVPPTKQAGLNSACNGAHELSIWLTGIANVALTDAIAQASTPISTGILSVIGSISSDLADFGWLLNALSEYWNGTQLTAIQTALNTDSNQALFATCCYCAIGQSTKITGGTLSAIANAIQGNFTDVPLLNFLYNFVLSISPGQADLQYQIGALDTSSTYDCSAIDCSALQDCYSVNPATLQPFYVPQWVIPNMGIKYSKVAGCWYFPVPPYSDSQSVGLRVDMYAMTGVIPDSAHEYAVYFNAHLLNVAQSASNDAYPLTDTLTANTDGSYTVSKRYVEVRGEAESGPGVSVDGLEVTGICYRVTMPSVGMVTHRSDLPYRGPASIAIPGTLTFAMPSTGADSGLYMHESWIDFSMPVKVTCVSVGQWVGTGGDGGNTLFGSSAVPVTFADPHYFGNVKLPPMDNPGGQSFGTVQSLYLNARGDSSDITYVYYIEPV